jgi:TPR repeat protein
MHLTGDGVPKNAREARRWFQKAAAQGFPASQAILENF